MHRERSTHIRTGEFWHNPSIQPSSKLAFLLLLAYINASCAPTVQTPNYKETVDPIAVANSKGIRLGIRYLTVDQALNTRFEGTAQLYIETQSLGVKVTQQRRFRLPAQDGSSSRFYSSRYRGGFYGLKRSNIRGWTIHLGNP